MLKIFKYVFLVFINITFLGLIALALIVAYTAKSLPDYEVLEKYEPSVLTRIHAADGSLMAQFAQQRRLYLPIQAIPDRIKAAFISAEDKNFYNHFGLDPEGLLRAILKNIKNFSSGKRPEGASTITQQVAKNFLLTSDPTLTRKIKEALLSIRIEKAFSKDKILELYLNEIYLGRGAYGIAAAALTYFNKSVDQLSVNEAAYLAALPKGPANYDPFKHTERALVRRNWVIDRMQENGYITQSEAEAAKKAPLGAQVLHESSFSTATEYFTEEVRRQLLAKYGEKVLYNGGLSVRTTVDPKYQLLARKALQRGLIKFDENHGWRGAYKHITFKDDWGAALAEIPALNDLPEWSLAVVLKIDPKQVTIGLQPQKLPNGSLPSERKLGTICAQDMAWAYYVADKRGNKNKVTNISDILSVGDVVFVHQKTNNSAYYQLQQLPKVQGALVAMEPHTGRVVAMVGGFSFAYSEFNRATQAYRQPGSSFKPIVYAAALDNGYTPASVVFDGPLEINEGNGEVWTPKNYGATFAGPSTLRYGIEHSRNLMTVRLANDLGMPIVAEYAKRFGLYDNMPPVLSMALGAGDTTLLKMVTAYAVIANGGRSITPSLIDRIQDRYGKSIYRHDQRECVNCNVPVWHNQAEPQLIDNSEQVLDPMTAYQVTSMMEGVIQRGTGIRLRYLGRHLAGKTGTTNDCKDSWFIGYTPNLVVGVYVGYDQPRSMGVAGTGSALAEPIFGDFIANALKDQPDVPFQKPEGMQEIAINGKTGMAAQPGDDNLIIEAFKPGTGPADIYHVIGQQSSYTEGVPVQPNSMRVQDALKKGDGGLY